LAGTRSRMTQRNMIQHSRQPGYRRRMANDAPMLERRDKMLSELSPRREASVSAACLPSNTALCQERVYLGTLNTRNISASLPLVSCFSLVLHLSSVMGRDLSHQLASSFPSGSETTRLIFARGGSRTALCPSAAYINEHLRSCASSLPAALIENDDIA